jgi:hypothetical protein
MWGYGIGNDWLWKAKKWIDIGNKSDIKISQNDGITTIKEGTLTNKSAPIWKSLWNRD